MYSESSPRATDRDPLSVATVLRIVALYLAFGVVWVLVTDLWDFGVREPMGVASELVEGFLFVALSGVIIFGLVRWESRRHRRSEERWTRTRDLLDRVFGGLDDALFIVDVETRSIVDCNRAAERLFGYSREELIGESTRKLHLDEESFEEFGRISASMLDGDAVFRGEFELRRSDGTVFETEHTVFFGDPDRRHAVSVVRDISERERRQHELRESRELVSRILATTTDGVVYIDRDRTVVFANEAAARISGVPREKMVGSVVRDEEWNLRRDDGELLPLERYPFVRALREGLETKNLLVTYERPDGQRLRLAISSVPVRGSSGEVVGAVSTFRDVTEAREEEKRRRHRERRFRRLITHVSDLIAEIDVEGTIRFIGPSVERIIGYTASELEGTSAFELVHPEDREEVAASLARAVADPESLQRIEYRGQRKDGSWLFFEAVGSAIEDGDPGVVVTSRDVTGRRETEEALQQREEQLRRAQKMEAIGRLAGGVAHDFNNMLTAILGNCDLAEMEFREGEEIGGEIQEIRKAAEQARNLTGQLLAFSRQQIRDPRPIDPGEVIPETLKILYRTVPEDIAIELDLTDRPCRILADPGQLEQVVMNLAVNAGDAMPRGGTLTLESEVVDLEEPLVDERFTIPPGPYYRLAVSDTGEGIPRDHLDLAFEPFFTTKGPGEGTGLGLATVYGVVKQNGGFIGVYSEVGRGTTFKIYLPLVEPPEKTGEKGGVDREIPWEEAGEEPPASETILVAEDEESVRRLISRILTRRGYTVLVAEDGVRALEKLESLPEPPDLLITDVVMPDMDGQTLARRFRDLFGDLPVLFTSGYTEKVISKRGIVEEDVDLVQKPFSPSVLLRRVEAALGRRDSTASRS